MALEALLQTRHVFLKINSSALVLAQFVQFRAQFDLLRGDLINLGENLVQHWQVDLNWRHDEVRMVGENKKYTRMKEKLC